MGWEALVCGGGAAGLAAAAMLQRRGLRTLVLEGSDRVGAAWRTRHEDLRLNSVGWLSSLPGMRGRWGWGHYPTRDEWIDYLERYRRHHGIQVRSGTRVRRIHRDGHGWRTELEDGWLRAPGVVVATGLDSLPFVPPWPGRDTFSGVLLHAAEYEGPWPFAGTDVLVAGANVSGVEIASQLAMGGAARVRLSVRTPPNLLARHWLGLPLHPAGLVLDRLPMRLADALGRLAQRVLFGDLSAFGLPRAPQGISSNVALRGMGPAFDDGNFVSALRQGRIEVVPAVAAVDGASVVLGDGSRIEPEMVIAATGYRRNLEPLVGHLDVLDAEGHPLVTGAETLPHAPGLFFAGYMAGLTGPLHAMGSDARRIARAAAALRRTPRVQRRDAAARVG